MDLFPGKMPAIAAVPQIVVFRRTLEGLADDATAPPITKDVSLLERKIGIYEIRDWVEQGVFVDARLLAGER